LCGGGIFVLDIEKSILNIHICNQAEVKSYGMGSSVDFVKSNYPKEAQKWLCDTGDQKYRSSLSCD